MTSSAQVEHRPGITLNARHAAVDRVSSVNGCALAERPDGRRIRRDRNSAAVVDATIELFQAGQLHPTAQQLADRSGVSLRSVFRYFADMHDLVLHAIEAHDARIEPMFRLPDAPGERPLDERIATIAAQRAQLCFAVLPVARAGRLREHQSRAIAALGERRRLRLQAQIESWFAPELDRLAESDRRLLVGCLGTAMQLEAGEHLHVACGLGPDEVEAAYRLVATRLLTPPMTA